MKMNIGKIGFIVGFFGALLLGLLSGLGLFEAGAWMTVVLIIAGLIIGFMNITTDEAMLIMVSALIIGLGAGVLATLPFIGVVLEAMLASLATVVIPVGIVVAVKTFMVGAK